MNKEIMLPSFRVEIKYCFGHHVDLFFRKSGKNSKWSLEDLNIVVNLLSMSFIRDLPGYNFSRIKIFKPTEKNNSNQHNSMKYISNGFSVLSFGEVCFRGISKKKKWRKDSSSCSLRLLLIFFHVWNIYIIILFS